MPFALPLALIAGVGVPALAAIYWLRNRFRRHTVSSLILWADQSQAREGGARVRRLRLPLLFFLELATIILLVAAAARPVVRVSTGARPLVVVLDDSYSMLAGGSDAPRERAIEAVVREIRRRSYYSIRFVRAGQSPQLLGEPVRTAREARALLKDWTCRSPADCLDAATSFAAELGGRRARILVVTDHAPRDELGSGRIEWRSFGEPRGNVAFITATRSLLDGKERCLLEVANLSSEPATTTLTLGGLGASESDAASPTAPTRLELGPHQMRRMRLEFDEQSAPLEARLDDASLAIDNRVVLVRDKHEPVRVQISVADARLRGPVERAVAAVRDAVLVEAQPALVITDRPGYRPPSPETWVLRLLIEEEAEAYIGPFVLDRTHPLTEGLSLEGVVWAAGKTEDLSGMPVISAGNVPLVVDTESLAGRHDVRLRLRPDISTLHTTPNWPILIWNFIDWCGAQAPGPRQTNVRLGLDVVVTVEPGTESARVTSPSGEARDVPVHGGRLTVNAAEAGIYTVQAGPARYTFAANALYKSESDLSGAATGEWGDWPVEANDRREYRSIAWVLLLACLATMGAHMGLASRRR